MGYTTKFVGRFKLSKKLTLEQYAFLKRFNESRRVVREVSKLPIEGTHSTAGLPLGKLGCYYVDEAGFYGQADNLASVIDHNSSGSQPSLWCQWTPSKCCNYIEWDGGEKFYSYVEWIEYLIEHFLEAWGLFLTGEVEWYGQDRNDIGTISIINNVITIL